MRSGGAPVDVRAASQLIRSTFLEIGFENVVGSLPAFINLPDTFFSTEHAIPIPPEQVVFVIQGSKPPDPNLLKGLRQFATEGYIFALEDVRNSPEMEPLLELASYAMIDPGKYGEVELAELILSCRRHGLKIVAQHIDSAEALTKAQQYNADYYEGHYFSQPELIQGRCTPDNHSLLTALLDTLQEGADMQRVEMLFIQDAALCYKLLRYIDCANYQARSELDSFHEALTLLGIETLRKWVSLLLMSDKGKDEPDTPFQPALLRARMCEHLAKKNNTAPPAQARTIGLFSCLETTMAISLVELLDSVPLHSAVKLALLDHEGELGEILSQVLEFERTQANPPDTADNVESDLAEHYRDALEWANDYKRTLMD